MSNKKLKYEIEMLKEEFERRTNFSNMKLSEYNTNTAKQTGMLLVTQMKEHMEESILPAYARARYSDEKVDKMFYCNYLCIILFSFIELYSQSLNVFYDLKMLPAHKYPMDNPLLCMGVVEQMVDGVESKSGKTVTVDNVLKKIDDSYKSNEYYSGIKKILESDEMARLRELRNYQMHYQSIFTRCRQNYSFSENESSFSMQVLPKKNPYQEKEYAIFIKLATDIIEKEINLVIYFMQMFTDKKMIHLEDEEQEVGVIECLNCGKSFIFPQKIIDIHKKIRFLVPHENCEGRFDYEVLERKKVHPELYNAIVTETIDMFEKVTNESSD